MDSHITRRGFLAATVAGAAMLSSANPLFAQAQSPTSKRFKIITFSKPFQSLSFDDTADLVADVGWDGIECPVRAKGQVEPQRVEEDLPKFVDAMKKRQREILTLTTDIREVTPLNERVLRTAAKLGIRKYRLGFASYTKNKSIPNQLAEIQPRYRELAALNKELGIQAGHQNHSGANNIGASVWDIYLLIKDLDPRYFSVHFDIGHATIEGGMSWPIQARLMQPYYGAVYIKDFVWEKGRNGWRTRWCPLGDGLVRKSFFDELKKSPYTGPISQHHEYFPPNATVRDMIPSFKKDLAVFKSWLA